MSGALAIIPARAGSKGVADKNVAPVAGRPLLAWTIDCALSARRIDRAIVSTDCDRIAGVARDCGAEVPFRRPEDLARDDTPGIEPILHALRWLERNEGYLPEWVVCLQPTSPLRTAADVDVALHLGEQRGADGVVSVTAARSHPFWCTKIDEEGWLAPFLDGVPEVPSRQQLPPAYALNGAVYAGRRSVVLERASFRGRRTLAHPMPEERSLDIDTPFDLEVADAILRKRLAERSR